MDPIQPQTKGILDKHFFLFDSLDIVLAAKKPSITSL